MSSPYSHCSNCGWIGCPTIQLDEVKDLLQRIGPGEQVPSGECPKCGALCHLLDETKAMIRFGVIRATELKESHFTVGLFVGTNCHRVTRLSWNDKKDAKAAAEDFQATFNEGFLRAIDAFAAALPKASPLKEIKRTRHSRICRRLVEPQK